MNVETSYRKSTYMMIAAICGTMTLTACQTTEKTAEAATATNTEQPTVAPDSPFMFHEAPTPEGWPAPTPVGEIQLKQYPACRVAVTDAEAAKQGEQNSMFMTLFRHIKKNDIKMTAPVEMTYDSETGKDESDTAPRPVAMSFLYRTMNIGKAGVDGNVDVRDVPAQMFVSLGVRGDYTGKRFETAVQKLRDYLADHTGELNAIGPPRYLGYNSPFVPWFLKYGEVQIPVTRRANHLVSVH